MKMKDIPMKFHYHPIKQLLSLSHHNFLRWLDFPLNVYN